MSQIDVLLAIHREDAKRYYQNLNQQKDLRPQIVTTAQEVMETLGNNSQRVDVLVLDNHLEDAFELVEDVRHTYPRLVIVLIDEDADFALPGRADDVSTEPFRNDDLVRRIMRLMSDRQLETLRADSMPAIREFAKQLRLVTGSGDLGKQQAAVNACSELGYDYVAFYKADVTQGLSVRLRAQAGPPHLQAAAPEEAGVDDIVGWVAKSAQSRTAGPQDSLNYRLVTQGRMGSVAAVPVSTTTTYGVLVACRLEPDSINQSHVLMLELISAQLAAAVSKE
ncbi:MAG: GAF domain-containing protein [Anaerolineae bacterium]|nr:GAF domain-containing protein [Anaerolineae bacterium]